MAEDFKPSFADLERDLEVTAPGMSFLASWFGFGWSALEELRLTVGAQDVSRTQLWPGHLDPAIDPAMLPWVAGLYVTDGMPLTHPYLSPAFGDFTGLPLDE